MSTANADLQQFLKSQNSKEAQRKLDKYMCEQTLRNYIPYIWPAIEPVNKYQDGYHIHAMSDHLEAVTNNQINRLLINVPPGFMKSLITEVFWPSWEWGPKNLPSTRYVSASYSVDLTIRDNMKMRRIISHDLYQSQWGDRFCLTDDQNAKIKFENNVTGFKLATSVGGLGTGERGDRFIIDDPHNVKDGESDIKRGNTLLWMSETVPTRINDPLLSAIIVIMQRVHEQDVSGFILAQELGYTHLCLPMEYDPMQHCRTLIGFSDKRTKAGELLWPERHTPEVIARDKKALGEYAYAGQYQQLPAPRGGGMFKRAWFSVVDYDQIPAGGRVVRAWDLAATDDDPNAAWTVGARLRYVNNQIYVEDVIRFRAGPADVEKKIQETAEADGTDVIISIPQDPGQAGKSQKRWMANGLMGYTVRFSLESGSKEMRALSFATQAEAGNVRVVLGSWNNIFFDELVKFPVSKFKDQVDACSRAMAELVKKRKQRLFQPPEMIGTRPF